MQLIADSRSPDGTIYLFVILKLQTLWFQDGRSFLPFCLDLHLHGFLYSGRQSHVAYTKTKNHQEIWLCTALKHTLHILDLCYTKYYIII